MAKENLELVLRYYNDLLTRNSKAHKENPLDEYVKENIRRLTFDFRRRFYSAQDHFDELFEYEDKKTYYEDDYE